MRQAASATSIHTQKENEGAAAFDTIVAAMAKISLSEVGEQGSTLDRAKLAETTEEAIRRHKAEDGYADLRPPTIACIVDPWMRKAARHSPSRNDASSGLE